MENCKLPELEKSFEVPKKVDLEASAQENVFLIVEVKWFSHPYKKIHPLDATYRIISVFPTEFNFVVYLFINASLKTEFKRNGK